MKIIYFLFDKWQLIAGLFFGAITLFYKNKSGNLKKEKDIVKNEYRTKKDIFNNLQKDLDNEKDNNSNDDITKPYSL